MFHSLLVPLDGSTFGEYALPMALGIARRAGTGLHLMHAHAPLDPTSGNTRPIIDSPEESAHKDRERAYLDGVVKRLAAVSTVPVTADLAVGPIGDAILQHAAERAADLIVMTTHGRGPLSRWWLGSVTDELTRRTSIPILLLRPQEGAPDLAWEPVLGRVVIPLDGSPLAEEVLHPAVALGRLMGARYTLLRVLVPTSLTGSDPTGFGMYAVDDSLLKERTAEAKAYLDGVAESLRSQSLRVDTHVVVAGVAALAILEEAKDPATDLIALETHGRHGFQRLLLGSVTDKVLRGTSGPVLVGRSSEK